MGGAHSRSTDPTQRLKNSQASLPRADEARANEHSRGAGHRQGALGQQATGNAYQAMSQFRSPGGTQRQDGVGGGLNLNVNVVSSTGLGLESGDSLQGSGGLNAGRSSVLAPPPSHIQLNSNANHAHITRQVAFGTQGAHRTSSKNAAVSRSAGACKQSLRAPSPTNGRGPSSPDKVGPSGVGPPKTSVINP